MAIIKDLKDPRIKDVTVTMVEVTPDLRQAKVNVTVRGDATKQKLCIRGLQNSAGFLQQKIGRRIDTRYTPRLEFVIDKGLENSLAVTRILEEVLPAERELHGETTEDTSEVTNPAETATTPTTQESSAPE